MCRLPCTPGWREQKRGEEPRRHRARFRLGGEQQRLLLRLAPGGELFLGAREAVHQLGAGRAQLLSGAGEVQAPAALLEERDLERLGELLQLQGNGGLGEVQLLGGAGHAAEAGDGLEHEELRKQPMTKETARSGTRHLGSLSVTEVWLAALDGLPERPGIFSGVTAAPLGSYSPAETAF